MPNKEAKPGNHENGWGQKLGLMTASGRFTNPRIESLLETLDGTGRRSHFVVTVSREEVTQAVARANKQRQTTWLEEYKPESQLEQGQSASPTPPDFSSQIDRKEVAENLVREKLESMGFRELCHTCIIDILKAYTTTGRKHAEVLKFSQDRFVKIQTLMAEANASHPVYLGIAAEILCDVFFEVYTENKDVYDLNDNQRQTLINLTINTLILGPITEKALLAAALKVSVVKDRLLQKLGGFLLQFSVGALGNYAATRGKKKLEDGEHFLTDQGIFRPDWHAVLVSMFIRLLKINESADATTPQERRLKLVLGNLSYLKNRVGKVLQTKNGLQSTPIEDIALTLADFIIANQNFDPTASAMTLSMLSGRFHDFFVSELLPQGNNAMVTIPQVPFGLEDISVSAEYGKLLDGLTDALTVVTKFGLVMDVPGVVWPIFTLPLFAKHETQRLTISNTTLTNSERVAARTADGAKDVIANNQESTAAYVGYLKEVQLSYSRKLIARFSREDGVNGELLVLTATKLLLDIHQLRHRPQTNDILAETAINQVRAECSWLVVNFLKAVLLKQLESPKVALGEEAKSFINALLQTIRAEWPTEAVSDLIGQLALLCDKHPDLAQQFIDCGLYAICFKKTQWETAPKRDLLTKFFADASYKELSEIITPTYLQLLSGQNTTPLIIQLTEKLNMQEVGIISSWTGFVAWIDTQKDSYLAQIGKQLEEQLLYEITIHAKETPLNTVVTEVKAHYQTALETIVARVKELDAEKNQMLLESIKIAADRMANGTNGLYDLLSTLWKQLETPQLVELIKLCATLDQELANRITQSAGSGLSADAAIIIAATEVTHQPIGRHRGVLQGTATQATERVVPDIASSAGAIVTTLVESNRNLAFMIEQFPQANTSSLQLVEAQLAAELTVIQQIIQAQTSHIADVVKHLTKFKTRSQWLVLIREAVVADGNLVRLLPHMPQIASIGQAKS